MTHKNAQTNIKQHKHTHTHLPTCHRIHACFCLSGKFCVLLAQHVAFGHEDLFLSINAKSNQKQPCGHTPKQHTQERQTWRAEEPNNKLNMLLWLEKICVSSWALMIRLLSSSLENCMVLKVGMYGSVPCMDAENGL